MKEDPFKYNQKFSFAINTYNALDFGPSALITNTCYSMITEYVPKHVFFSIFDLRKELYK